MIAPVSGAANAGRRSRARRVEPVDAHQNGVRQNGPRQSDNPAPISAERALVPTEQPTQSARPRVTHLHGDAAFLTHLIATREGLPQTRARRRAEPDHSAAAYATTARSTIQTATGRILKHSA